MGNKATVPVLAAGLVLAATGVGQAVPEWRHIGNSAIDLGLAGPASGSVNRAWYSPDGARLLIRTSSGKLFQTNDFETWLTAPADTPVPPILVTQPSNFPEPGAQFRRASPARLYAFGTYVHRSDDSGAHWTNLTGFQSRSLVGGPLLDLAVSPVNPDEIVVAGDNGVFRTLDAGLVWSSLNENLPNLPATHILALPAGSRGVQAEIGDALIAEWPPGERQVWHPENNPQAVVNRSLRGALTLQFGVEVTAVAVAGDYVYAGTANGTMHVSATRGTTWQDFQIPAGGPVTSFWVDPARPRNALATLGSRTHEPGIAPAHVVGTINAGFYWDSLSDGLADAAAYGITADLTGNAIYAATERGVFLSRVNLVTMGAAPWVPVSGLPAGSASDVKLDAAANRLWVALEGYGVYEGRAPHRMGDPRIVSSADYAVHGVAPGALLSVPGARLRSASSGQNNVPVLDAQDAESQIQVPFNTPGATTLTLTMVTDDGRQISSSLPMGLTAPAIWVNPDGSPFLLDADNFMLDAARRTHARARIQILATGLGAVRPYWEAGTPAPLENPPEVVTDVTAWLDGAPVQVTRRAVLAPGLIGFYLVEIEIPSIVNFGPAELYIEAEGQQSNHVRVYIEP